MEEFRWECPYPSCPYSILSYTEDGFNKRRSDHLDGHLKKIREERLEREERLKKLGVKLADVIRSSNPDKLLLTMYDMEQFEIHKIKIDEDCIIDGYSSEFELPKSGH